jgi:hypothetical protein
VLAVELRPEETGRSLQNFVGTLRFSDLLLKFPDPLRLRGRHPGRVTVVDVALAHPGAHRFHAVAELAGNPVHRPMLGAQLGTQSAHIRTAAAFSSGLYLRVVGFPGDCSFGMTPSSFPRSVASRSATAGFTTSEAIGAQMCGAAVPVGGLQLLEE